MDDTVKYYNEHAGEWIKHVDVGRLWLDELKEFNQLLPSGKIIEFGFGAGWDAKTLVSYGYDYTGIDASESFVKIASQNYPGINFLQMPIEDLQFPEKTFDGFIAIAMLLHIPKSSIESVLQGIKRIIKPGGIGLITMKSGAGERRDFKTKRFYSYYSKDSFAKVLEKNGFKILKSFTKQDNFKTWLLGYFVRSS